MEALPMTDAGRTEGLTAEEGRWAREDVRAALMQVHHLERPSDANTWIAAIEAAARADAERRVTALREALEVAADRLETMPDYPPEAVRQAAYFGSEDARYALAADPDILAIEDEAARPLTVERLAGALRWHEHQEHGAGGLRIRATHMDYVLFDSCAAAILHALEADRG
jgi:hypothetical protein